MFVGGREGRENRPQLRCGNVSRTRAAPGRSGAGKPIGVSAPVKARGRQRRRKATGRRSRPTERGGSRGSGSGAGSPGAICGRGSYGVRTSAPAEISCRRSVVVRQDAAGRLRSVDKAELKSQSLEQRSGMPSFQGKLSEAQLNDLVAFLATLKGDAR